MYPNHKNLLPAYYDNDAFNPNDQDKKWVSKPIFGREGMGVFFSSNFSNFQDFVDVTENNFGSETNNKVGKSIYQAEVTLPAAQGRIIQTSSWMVRGMPAGLAFREGKIGHHFEDSNPFLLHSVKNQPDYSTFTFKHSP